MFLGANPIRIGLYVYRLTRSATPLNLGKIVSRVAGKVTDIIIYTDKTMIEISWDDDETSYITYEELKKCTKLFITESLFADGLNALIFDVASYRNGFNNMEVDDTI